MKKILILAYDYPPLNSVAAHRPASWFKYFPESDLFPVVVTMHWRNTISDTQQYIIPSFRRDITSETFPEGRIIRVPCRPGLRDRLFYYRPGKLVCVRKILSFIQLFSRHLFFFQDSSREIFYQADEILTREKFDCILITAEPFILFKYGHLLSQKHNIPWIADYRDCWSKPIAPKYQDLISRGINATFFKFIEKRYLKNVAQTITPSPSYRKAIELSSGRSPKIIFNGFEEVSGTSNSENQDVFQIAYAGRIYPHQNLEVFLRGLRMFISRYKVYKCKVVFYGLDFYPQNKRRLFSFDRTLNQFLHVTPRLSYEDLYNQLEASQVLLLLSNKEANWLNAKVFDYLPIQRRILLVTSDNGILKSIIDKTKSGSAVNNAEEVCEFLNVSFNTFKEKGNSRINSDKYQQYSRKVQAQLLAKIIHGCAE